MAFTIEKGFVNDVQYTDRDFASYIEGAFGSVGTFAYTTSGLQLNVEHGGVLMGGYFYKIVGSESFTMPANQTRYIIAKKEKNDEQYPVLMLVSTIEEDSESSYVALLFKLVSNQQTLTVERVGGYPTALYRAINNRLNRAVEAYDEINQRVDGVVKILSGTKYPDKTLGRDGDVYIKY
jgi:hypothetical protein